MSKIQLGVFGSDSDHCSKELYDIAFEVGIKLPPEDVVLYTGGLGGVMEAVNKGFYSSGGMSVGILPGSNANESNDYCTLRIPTGIGFARAQILANSIDAAIVVGGGGGTMIEMLECYWRRKPIIALASSGGVAKEYANKFLDERELIRIEAAYTVDDVVSRAIEFAQYR